MAQKLVSFYANPWNMLIGWLASSVGIILFNKAYYHTDHLVVADLGTLIGGAIVFGIIFLIARSRQRNREQAASGPNQPQTGNEQKQTKEQPRMSLDDQQYYDTVAQELQNKELKPGLWTRAIAEAGGENDQAKAIYIKLRVAQLAKEARKQTETERPPKSRASQFRNRKEYLAALRAEFEFLTEVSIADMDQIPSSRFNGSASMIPGSVPSGDVSEAIGLLEFKIVDAVKAGLLKGVREGEEWWIAKN